jgi:hypothetical protein
MNQTDIGTALEFLARKQLKVRIYFDAEYRTSLIRQARLQ